MSGGEQIDLQLEAGQTAASSCYTTCHCLHWDQGKALLPEPYLGKALPHKASVAPHSCLMWSSLCCYTVQLWLALNSCHR